MAAWPLNPLAFVWRCQGLDWLMDVPDECRALSSHPRPAAAPPRPDVPVASAAPGNAARADEPKPTPAAGEGAKTPARPLYFTSRQWPADCPEKWGALMGRSRPAKILWTYYALGDDMLGTDPARKERGDFLRRLLGDLGHPRGTHGFWPMAIDGEPRPDLFFAGAQKLGARGIVVFGSRAATGLGIRGARPLLQIPAQGRLIMVLWELDALTRQETNYGATLAFLRAAIATAL